MLYSFETSNGILRRESGLIVHEGESDQHLYIEGEYTYTDPDGNVHVIRYQADKNGFEVLPPAVPAVSTCFKTIDAGTILCFFSSKLPK